jgi:hypothetical protein
MDEGTGVDLWFSGDSRDLANAGTLAEERHMERGERHGIERWWTGDDATVSQECHFWRGEAHGIFRAWNKRGRLRRQYPQYWIHGERVNKRQYLKASITDAALPSYNETEDAPQRRLPLEYADQRAQRS